MSVVLTSSSDGILTVTIHRPEKLNALSLEVLHELHRVFQLAEGDPAVRCVILTGAGGKAFVAGADIAEMARFSPTEARAFSRLGTELVSRIENLPKPVIASINGYALGGGFEIALGCTLRIASENAVFGQPEIHLGIMPGFGGTQRLVRIVGKSRALEICLLGDRFDARRAAELGIVHLVCKPEELSSKTEQVARRITSLPPIAVRYILEAIHRGSEASLPESLEYESNLFALCFATEDMKEGTRAFLEKRAARFLGK